MEMLKVFFVLFTVELTRNVMAFNPLLTYMVRYKKVTFHPNVTGNYTIDQHKDEQYVNGYFTIHSQEKIDKGVVYIERCNQEGYDCEYFQNWVLPKICSMLKEKNQMWSRWFEAYNPPAVCPLDKIHYRVKNASIDVGLLINWYPEITDYQWIITQKMFAGDTYVGAFSLKAAMFGYRKKKNILQAVFT